MPLKGPGRRCPCPSKDVSLTGLDIAESGAVVPMWPSPAPCPASSAWPCSSRKPQRPGCPLFDVSDAIDANFNVRVKMGQSSNVTAVALMADGKVLFAQKEIKVALGGCGGDVAHTNTSS